MRPARATLLGLALILGIGSAAASAEPMVLDAVLSTQEDISLAFKDAKVVEFGMHDVMRGEDAKASGYIEATTRAGDIAYFRWRLRASFVSGPDGKVKPINGGYWELSGGTGAFATLRGVGTMLIEFLNKTERRYVLEGDLSPAP